MSWELNWDWLTFVTSLSAWFVAISTRTWIYAIAEKYEEKKKYELNKVWGIRLSLRLSSIYFLIYKTYLYTTKKDLVIPFLLKDTWKD